MRTINWLATFALVIGLAACGGGGGSAGTSGFGSGAGTGTGTNTGTGSTGGTTNLPAAAITLSLSQTVVTLASPATVTATVKDGSTGAPLPGKVVTFSTSAGGTGTPSSTTFGTFTPSSGTALTDSNGVAVVSLAPSSSSANGAANVVAAVTVNGVTSTATTGFQFTASNVTVQSFTTDIGASTLSAYGQTNATVKVAGAAAGTPVTVTVTSTCVVSGKATLVPASVTTTTGTATFTYKDQGCGAVQTSDSLQAAISATSATAQVSVSLDKPAASSIGFSAATPPVIYLKGSGLGESSVVSFLVKDSAGNPLPNQSVNLELLSATGGLTLEGGTAVVTRKSDGNGSVSAIINSGTVPTPVRVKATLTGTVISTVSNQLTVAVGLPSEVNFGLAQATTNIEGFDYIDTPNTYTIIASDRSGNPVPDGTAINFVTEGGQIQASRTIQAVNGIARADAAFASSLPKPADGRITITAYALGEESFKDLNGNNVYDAGEPFQDLGDVYRDRLWDGVFDLANDEFISLSITGSSACALSAEPELVLNVSIPSRPATCDGKWGGAYVRRSIETVLSTSAASPLWFNTPPGDSTSTSGGVVHLQTSSAPALFDFLVVDGSSLRNMPKGDTISFLVRDANSVRLNPVAAGSTIAAEATDGLTIKVLGGSPVPNTSEATGAAISYLFDDKTTAGTITVKITSPKGLTSVIFIKISMT